MKDLTHIYIYKLNQPIGEDFRNGVSRFVPSKKAN